MIDLSTIFIDILKEGSYDSSGVGDKEFERIMGFSINNPNIKAQSELQRQLEAPVGKVQGSFIYKNPKTLENFDRYVRAIGYIDGNLYVAQENGYFIHSDIIDSLNLKQNDENNLRILRLIRIGDKDMFFVLTKFGTVNLIQGNKILKSIQKRNPQYRIIKDST